MYSEKGLMESVHAYMKRSPSPEELQRQVKIWISASSAERMYK